MNMDYTAWTPRALSVLRIVTGMLFLEHGTQKLLGFPPSEHAAPALFSLIGVQGILELVGGFLVLIGLFYSTGCVHPRRRYGGCLFHGARPKELLPDAQWRPARYLVLPCLPLLSVRWRRANGVQTSN